MFWMLWIKMTVVWVDQCSIAWKCDVVLPKLHICVYIYDVINQWGKTDALLCAVKDFLGTQLLKNFRVCYEVYFYICIWCLLKWRCMCNCASKVGQIAVHILSFLRCELKINLYGMVWFLYTSKLFFNLEPGLFPLSVFVASGFFHSAFYVVGSVFPAMHSLSHSLRV